MPVTIVGNNTPTAGGVVYGDGTNYASTAAGTSGQVLQSNGSSAPSWITLATGAASITRSTKTSAYTLVAGDKGNLIEATSGTFNFNVTAASSLGAGWWCYVSNAGSGFTTIDPNASETVTVNGNALTTWVLWPNEMGLLVCDGSNFFYYCMRYGFCTVTVSGAPSSVTFNTGLAYRTNLSLTWNNITLSGNDQLKLFVNSSISPSYTAGIVFTSSSSAPTATTGITDNFTLSVAALASAPMDGSGTFKLSSAGITFNGANRYRNTSNLVAYGNYQSVFAETISSITDISIIPNTQLFATGTFILQQL